MNQSPQRLDAVAFGGEHRIRGHAARHAERVGRIKLAVQIGMDQQHRVDINRGKRHVSFLPSAAINRRRARANRDITVPIGTSVTSAISR